MHHPLASSHHRTDSVTISDVTLFVAIPDQVESDNVDALTYQLSAQSPADQSR
jgi:hypothetical protein